MAIDATVWQGQDKVLNIVVNDANGSAKDLTGFTIVGYRIGKRLTDTTVLQLTSSANANGGVVAFGTRANGEVNVTLAAADMAITPMRYVHELILTDSSGNQDNVLTDSSDDDAYLTVKETLPAA